MRVELVLRVPAAAGDDDRKLVQRRRDAAVAADIGADALHQVAQLRASHQRLERPAQPAAARAGLDRVHHLLLRRGYLLRRQRPETFCRHRALFHNPPGPKQENPPSTKISVPVMKFASSETRNSVALATSQPVPMRPIGTCALRLAISASASLPASWRARRYSTSGVCISPGITVLQRMPCLA